MRVRALDADKDMTFGRGSGNFLINSPEAVAQKVDTRLMLLQGEWYVDNQAGTPWTNGILGNNTGLTRDQIIQQRVLSTSGVIQPLADYSSRLEPNGQLTVSFTLNTIYGTMPYSTILTVPGK